MVPSACLQPSMSWSGMRLPPFASAWYALTIWIWVAETPWPNIVAYLVWSSHELTGCRMPDDSPGKSMPVSWPMPNAFR